MKRSAREYLLVTGGCGFVGSHMVRAALKRGLKVVTLDALTYASTRRTLDDIEGHPDHVFVHGSIGDRELVSALLREYRPIAVVNLAAASHVDRSIDDPGVFVRTNILELFELLECARRHIRSLGSEQAERFRFLQVSTDEVFGSIASGAADVASSHRPSSPYSATKAAADDLVHSWGATYGLPVLISHSTNNYGAYQFPEKLIPHMILRALAEEPLPLYGDGQQQRDWLHVSDHVEGLFKVLRKGLPGRRYTVGTGELRTNLEVTQAVCRALDDRRPRTDGRSHADAITFVEDRPGHDRRYSIEVAASRRDLGLAPLRSLEAGLAETVDWYINRSDWWRPLLREGYSLHRIGTGTAGEASCDAD